MNHFTQKIGTFLTYLSLGVNFVWNLEAIKSLVLFSLAFVLLILQIRLHVIRIKNEKKLAKKNQKI